MKPIERMSSVADVFNVRRAVASIEKAEGEGWLVTLSCGHKELWELDPPTKTATCRECLALAAERMNAL